MHNSIFFEFLAFAKFGFLWVIFEVYIMSTKNVVKQINMVCRGHFEILVFQSVLSKLCQTGNEILILFVF